MSQLVKLFFCIFILTSLTHIALSQSKAPDLIGTWKIVQEFKAPKKLQPIKFVLLMDDSVYTIGVDSIGNSLPGASSGRWTVSTDSILLLYPSDKIAERRYYRAESENRCYYIGTNLKKYSGLPVINIHLERMIY